jgi:chromosome segregation protein
MTYIKQLELENFKSFAGRTKFSFVKGFNAIAGANGSGKSNVIDAFLFVFGGLSKKEMRSEVLTDLIFNGGKAQKPADSAKVSVVFDNSDHSFAKIAETEMEISRRVDQNGKSMFRVNGSATTREEVLNLLSDVKVRQESFNVIPQGKINDIIGSTSEERLGIINDISGISVFEEKKKKALSELEKVEGNISKIETIQREKKRHMNELEEEKKKAEEFKKLKTERYTVFMHHLVARKKIASEAFNKVNDQVKEAEEKNGSLSLERDTLTKTAERMNLDLENINNEAEARGEQELRSAEEKLNQADLELTKMHSVLDADKRNIVELENSIASADASYKELASQIADEDAKLKNVSKNLSELNALRADLIEKSFKSEQFVNDRGDLERKIADVTEKSSELRIALLEYPSVSEFHTKLIELGEKKRRLESEKRELTVKFSELKLLVDKTKAEANREDALVFSLRESVIAQRGVIESFSRASEVVKRLKSSVAGVYDVVSSLFTVKDDKYYDAILNSIGRRSDFIVVDSDLTARECISKLKTEKLGTFTFIPLNRMSVVNPVNKPDTKGVLDNVINLVNFDEKFSGAMSFVFGDTILVDNFETARGLPKSYRAVTMDGTVFEKSGVIYGGNFDREGLVTARKKYAKLQEDLNKHNESKKNYADGLMAMEPTLSHYLSRLKDLDADLKNVDFEMNTINTKLSRVSGSEAEISARLAHMEKDKLGLVDKLERLKAENVGIDLDYKKPVEELDSKIRKLQVDQEIAESKIEHSLRIEADRLGERITGLRDQRVEFGKHFDYLSQTIAKADSDLRYLKEEVTSKARNLEDIRKRRDALNKDIAATASDITAVTSKLQISSNHLNELKVKQAEAKVKFQTIEEEISKYVININEEAVTETPEVINKRLQQLDSKISSFGGINELAVSKFDELMVEYTEFDQKLVKLVEEKTKINGAIADIEKKKVESFMSTLSNINAIFSKTFNSFSGGNIELVPDKPESIFDGGLDFKVELPNKKVHNIRGLSGGEKSIVAISLILSISRYVEVSFYLLDEVDAALDPVNASKFASLIKAFSPDSQFILISHNETTLINADVMYGVTMTSGGLSKIVSVNLPKEQHASKA